MNKLRVLVLMHEDLVPPDDVTSRDDARVAEAPTEFDVVSTLKELGHDVFKIGVKDELGPLRNAIELYKPEIVFNLLEEFRGFAHYDAHVVGYLELNGIPYTGCNPRGLMLARDKALSKKVLSYHRIRVPQFAVFRLGKKTKRPTKLELPLIVKSLNEEASLGISKTSLVDSDEKLSERVQFIFDRIHTDAIAEEFIEGRELYVTVVGNRRLQVLPPWELVVENLPDDEPLIATAKAKWDKAYQKKWGIGHAKAKYLPKGVADELVRISKRIYRNLELTGYARLDYRLSPKGQLYFIEANPNPDIASVEEVASSAAAVGIPYPKLLQRLLSLGLNKVEE